MIKSKSELRSELLQKRNSLSSIDREVFSQSISSNLFVSEHIRNASIFHCYCSYGSEVITNELIQKVLSFDIQVVVPVVKNTKGELLHTTITSETIFEKGRYGIPQPTSISEITIDKLNNQKVLIIVPVVGFDVSCNRLGYGGGYYDRFLQQVPNAKKIGIAFSLQEVESIPIEKTDIPLDGIITEQKVLLRTNSI